MNEENLSREKMIKENFSSDSDFKSDIDNSGDFNCPPVINFHQLQKHKFYFFIPSGDLNPTLDKKNIEEKSLYHYINQQRGALFPC